MAQGNVVPIRPSFAERLIERVMRTGEPQQTCIAPTAVIHQGASCGCGWKHAGQGWMQASIEHAMKFGHKIEFKGTIDGGRL